MYGDTTTIRALAARLRERGDEIRGEATMLATRAEQVPWQGLAADAMREQARVRAAALRRTAALHDDAADALDRHAREVDRLKDLIAAIERKVHHLLAEAADGVGGLVGGAIHGAVHGLRDLVPGGPAGFVPPPPGSRAWLSVDLPGLGRS
ncbi:hypothetical protein [Nocardioides sp. T2.26MG-1]|uniref:hypothetical protein n=1 Tax=Nocardioides sp. T2.26MG-1 TaxID=3041166 RepID=UPI0024776F40|nr:hypothetical protein [Nocardioides sp. T2.26MG-1]CAI9401261.1 hypothetical protein HIDPHFAB_00574 [Nocardioides sp. T2.26MG-1]